MDEFVVNDSDGGHQGRVVEGVAEEDAKLRLLSWCARVASPSNLGDAPSRGQGPVPPPEWQAPVLHTQLRLGWSMPYLKTMAKSALGTGSWLSWDRCSFSPSSWPLSWWLAFYQCLAACAARTYLSIAIKSLYLL